MNTLKCATGFRLTRQCRACPWKVSTVPERDIPNYDRGKHEALAATCPGEGNLGEGRVFACHETREGVEAACVGWLAHELGDGNNIRVRMAAADGLFDPRALVLVGEQHETFEATLGKRRRPT